MAAAELVKPITDFEIDIALEGIDVNKALGLLVRWSKQLVLPNIMLDCVKEVFALL